MSDHAFTDAPLLLFGPVQRPLHHGWPLHGEVRLVNHREYGSFHSDFYVFSVESLTHHLEHHTRKQFQDWCRHVPAEVVEARWQQEVARVLHEARALHGFPEQLQQLDRLWRHWKRHDDVDCIIDLIMRKSLHLTEYGHPNPEKQPVIRYIQPGESSFWDDLPTCPRVVHGTLDLGDFFASRIRTGNAPFFSKAGARQRAAHLHTIGLLSDEEYAQLKRSIEEGPLPPSEDLTRADRVAAAYARDYSRVYPAYLAHALGAPINTGPRVLQARYKSVLIYLWDNHLLMNGSTATLKDAKNHLAETVANGLITAEEVDYLLSEVRKTDISESVPHPGPGFADC